MRRTIYLFALILVMALGTYLRLVDLGGPSLWHDEIVHLQVTDSYAQQPWYRQLTGVREVRGWTENGFVYYGLQTLGLRLAPGELGVRLFPAIVGILALPLMALCGQLLGGPIAGFTSTLLLAVAPLHVYFSREGRPYSLLMFLALALVYALLQKDWKRRTAVAWITCLAAAYVGIHSAPMLLAFLALSAVGCLRDLKRKQSILRSSHLQCVLAATVALGLVYGLYMTRSRLNVVDIDRLQSPAQQGANRSSQLASPVYESPLSRLSLERFLASMTTSGHQSILLERRSWALIGLAMVGLLSGLTRKPEEMVATAGMFVLPATLSIVALVAVDRWYGLRYTTTALPAFLLLVTSGVIAVADWVGGLRARERQGTGRRLTRWAAAIAMLAVFAVPNVAAARADPYRKLDWRGIARFLDQVVLEGEPILIPNAWSQICLGYYLRELDRMIRFVNLWESAETGESIVASTPKGWLLTAGFRKTNEVRTWMHQFHPVLKKKEEEMALFFFPDFVTLLETRFAAQKGAVFEKQFEAMGQRFDFGGAELTLQGRGWSFPEQNAAGIGYQWAMGDIAELGLPLGRPRAARIRFRVLPFQYPEATAQTLELRLNEKPLSTLELSGGWTEHVIDVPADAWTTAANILFLGFGRSSVPAEIFPGSQDRRHLSAAFDFLEVLTQDSTPDSPADGAM